MRQLRYQIHYREFIVALALTAAIHVIVYVPLVLIFGWGVLNDPVEFAVGAASAAAVVVLERNRRRRRHADAAESALRHWSDVS